MNAVVEQLPSFLVFTSRKCCGKCRHYRPVASMTAKRTPAGGVIYICDRCAPSDAARARHTER